MISPARVLGFLDITGAWDPRLAFVMGGGLLVALPFYVITRRRGTALFGGPVTGPASSTIDLRLLGGAAIFGMGWGWLAFAPAPR